MAISRMKKIAIVSIIVSIVVLYPTASYSIDYFYNVKNVSVNNEFLAARSNASRIDSSFVYNDSMKQYFQYNISVLSLPLCITTIQLKAFRAGISAHL